MEGHVLDPERPGEIGEWMRDSGVLENDDACRAPGGHAFLRRGDFGVYLTAKMLQHGRGDCELVHIRDLAVAVSRSSAGYSVQTASGTRIGADMLVIATGNPLPSLRPPFQQEHAAHPRIITNPLGPGCLDVIPQRARVLVVGGGLTALDILYTLLRRRHSGELVVISRRGLRPRRHHPQIVEKSGELSARKVSVDLEAPVPDFLAAASPSVRNWTRAVREQIERAQLEGHSWHDTMDAVRDVVWKIWPTLPIDEKHRFLRRLRVFYDVHRFRAPPMNDSLVRAAEARGEIQFAAATLTVVHAAPSDDVVRVEMRRGAGGEIDTAEFDYVVNCTGLDAGSAWRLNPVLKVMIEVGLLRLDPTRMGFDVGVNCEALSCEGSPQPTLRVVGPPSAGTFGDPLGVPFISGQVRRILPDVLRTLESFGD